MPTRKPGKVEREGAAVREASKVPRPPKKAPGISPEDEAEDAERMREIEAAEAAEPVCTCVTGMDPYCPADHGKRREPAPGPAPEKKQKQANLAGGIVDPEDVEHEKTEPKHKFETTYYRASIPRVDVVSIRSVGPTTPQGLDIVGGFLRTKPDQVRLPPRAFEDHRVLVAQKILALDPKEV